MSHTPRAPLSLKILHPCTRTWDSLEGDHRRRYCDDCNLHVHNASELTDTQAHNLLASPSRVCMSGLAKSDGQLLTKDALKAEAKIHLRHRPLLRITAALGLISIPTALAACAQQKLGGCNAALSDSKQSTPPELRPMAGSPADLPVLRAPSMALPPTPAPTTTPTPLPDPTVHYQPIDPKDP